jgi:DNA-binding phage protein
MAKARPFDAAEYLNSPAMIVAYLREAFKSGDTRLMLVALRDVAWALARGVLPPRA